MVDHQQMVINMTETKLCTIEKIEQFMAASADVEFRAHGNDLERYAHISRVLKRFDYPKRNRHDRGVLLRYIKHTSGYSRAQVTRLIKKWQLNRLAEIPLVKHYVAPVAPFQRKYQTCDIALLVEMDKAHDNVCGPATIHLFKRALNVYEDKRYERLACISSSHIYNLRKSAGYQEQRIHFTKTNPTCNSIGVRHAPQPEGRAGFVRIDSVHQGDQDGVKGVYHITCVDSVTQWQIESCVERISSAFLLPVLALVIEQFPFEIEGFHSDNGSEYINHEVANMLDELRIKQTKSRSRHSNDNALAESKNASVVRKYIGHAHIPKEYAPVINNFYKKTFNPWLNLHRPCMFATCEISAKGKVVKTYKHGDTKTPLEAVVLLEKQGLVKLKSATILAELLAEAKGKTDLKAAQEMQREKSELFASFIKQKLRA